MPIETPVIAWRAIGPVLALAGGAVVVLLAGSFASRAHRALHPALTLAALGASAYLTFDVAEERIVGMQGMVASDGVALFTNLILLFAATVAVALSYDYLHARGIDRFEYYALLLLATAGMVLLASSNDLLMVFISLEILSLALYVMVGISRRDPRAQEASLKYFLLGGFSSAVLLYGVALTYGATDHTNIAQITARAVQADVDERLLFGGVALILTGFLFKVAAVPFHMWTPDVYQGAPTPVTAFMAAGTKAAAFAALLRVFLVSFGPLQWDWRPVLFVVAIVTMAFGSLIAIAQSDVKRMLAYSSIAHAGFILVGVVAASPEGNAGALFYLLVYAAMTLGAFAAVIVSAPSSHERLDLATWAGMGRKHPVFAGVMTLFLLSLAGLPPTAGFMGKFFVFSAAIDAGETGLVVAGALASVVASFFYLRLIVLMWLQEPSPEHEGIGLTVPVSAALALTALVTVAFGVWPQPMMDLARHAAVFTG